MRSMLRQPSAVVKLIAFINVVWLLVLLSLEVILVYEYDDKGLRDIIPSLLPTTVYNELDHPHRNRTSYKQCTYHIYRKYACVLVAATPSTLPSKTPPTASSDSFLPLLWFSVCCLDILISFVLYRAAEQKRPRLAFIWLWLAAGILVFQLIILTMFSLTAFSQWIWHESPLIGFCVFRLWSLYVVHKFYRSLVGHGGQREVKGDKEPSTTTSSVTAANGGASPPNTNASHSHVASASTKCVSIAAVFDNEYTSSRAHICSNGSNNCGGVGTLDAPGLKIRKLSHQNQHQQHQYLRKATMTADSLPTLIFKS